MFELSDNSTLINLEVNWWIKFLVFLLWILPDEIRKAFDSESSTSPAATFMKEFNLRFIKMFDDFITWSAEGVCRQLIELPRLIDAESTETQILLQLQLKGQRPISESLTRELSVSFVLFNSLPLLSQIHKIFVTFEMLLCSNKL